jgi:hypothetical protein
MVSGGAEGAVPRGTMLSSQNTFGRSVRYDSTQHLETPPVQYGECSHVLLFV